MRLAICLFCFALCAGPVSVIPAFAAEEEEDVQEARLSSRLRGMQYHPVGWTVKPGKLRLSNLIPMQPAGFPSDELNHWLSATYGLGDGWEVGAAVTGAERLGPGGEALFFGAAVQKQVLRLADDRTFASVGAYGMAGPHDQRNGSFYVSLTHRLIRRQDRGFGLDLHTGVKYELFDGDDYGSGSGVRPYLGATAPIGSRVFLSAEISPKQSWQQSNMFSGSVTYRVYKRAGITGGVRNNGYDTEPFVAFSF